ncbi:MAG TPA: Gfo/Idh/MocA family oxidoreductase [Thermomicrobiales bacterium]|jgi:predicted dehydrogenase|nr:Gfo/Idh/MocA family oxidoreductase [Thermomicrobiales bacterium]
MAGETTEGATRVGLAGLGRFGQLHAAALTALPEARLAAICDPNPDALAAVGERYGVAARFASFEAMLAAGGIDAVFIVTPEPLHAEQARLAIDRGLPVFLEKPLAFSAAEGAALVAAAELAKLLLQLGFVLRFETQHAIVREEIAAGRLGPLVSLRAKRNCSRAWFPDYGDRVHPIYETSIHDIDLFLWYVGAPCTRVQAVERNVSGRRYPDGCWALLEFAGGATAMLETSWFVPDGAPANVLTPTWRGTLDAELEVIGQRGTARIRALDSGLALWQPDYAAVPETGLWPEAHGQIGGALRAEDAHFIACARSGQPSTIASAADALNGLRIAEAIVEAAKTGRPVELPRAIAFQPTRR